MANQEQLDVLRQGAEVWNQWRQKDDSGTRPDLSNANLSNSNLNGANLSNANLVGVNLRRSDLSDTDLRGTNLNSANLSSANLGGVNLRRANLLGANLSYACLDGANLSDANLNFAYLVGASLKEAGLAYANLSGAYLRSANLHKAIFNETVFGNTDLSDVVDLDTCMHLGPSAVDFRTIAKSGRLPLEFLRGCGLPDTLIEYLPSLLNEPTQFDSCFISYSTKDQEFADRLYVDLQSKGVRCWFAPHDIQGGRKIHEQIDRAIQMHDRLLLILSPASMESTWVETEIAKARRRELQEKRRMLFPVRLVDFETLRDWECFDADAGKDSAREIREYLIPDFSNWKDHDCYQKEFEKLLRDLKPEGNAPKSEQ